MAMIHIGVVFGGRSGEHEVSLVSAQSVMKALSPEKYCIIPIGIAKSGRWVCGDSALDTLKHNGNTDALPQCVLLPDLQKHTLLILYPDGTTQEQSLDAMFPVLHGTFGEDGTIQGVFETAGIPYVGAGVLASAVCMNKIYQKRLFTDEGIPQVDYIHFLASAYGKNADGTIAGAEERLGYPMFVKPASQGSSVGINKAGNAMELRAAIEDAAQFDSMIVIEQAVPAPRELEIAVLGNEDPIASMPGEIIPGNEFYDYNAKYVDGSSKLVIPAEIPDALKERMQELALHAYTSLHCEGLARVDFLHSRETGELFVNEINTLPGFTSISMYPKLFAAAGIPYPELLDRLVALAFQRHEQQQTLQRSFHQESKWYEQ